MSDLTKRQSDALKAINKFIRDHKYPPTVRELGISLGTTSSSNTHRLLIELEGKGYIVREESKPRAIRVIRCAS